MPLSDLKGDALKKFAEGEKKATAARIKTLEAEKKAAEQGVAAADKAVHSFDYLNKNDIGSIIKTLATGNIFTAGATNDAMNTANKEWALAKNDLNRVNFMLESLKDPTLSTPAGKNAVGQYQNTSALVARNDLTTPLRIINSDNPVANLLNNVLTLPTNVVNFAMPHLSASLLPNSANSGLRSSIIGDVVADTKLSNALQQGAKAQPLSGLEFNTRPQKMKLSINLDNNNIKIVANDVAKNDPMYSYIVDAAKSFTGAPMSDNNKQAMQQLQQNINRVQNAYNKAVDDVINADRYLKSHNIVLPYLAPDIANQVLNLKNADDNYEINLGKVKVDPKFIKEGATKIRAALLDGKFQAPEEIKKEDGREVDLVVSKKDFLSAIDNNTWDGGSDNFLGFLSDWASELGLGESNKEINGDVATNKQVMDNLYRTLDSNATDDEKLAASMQIVLAQDSNKLMTSFENFRTDAAVNLESTLFSFFDTTTLGLSELIPGYKEARDEELTSGVSDRALAGKETDLTVSSYIGVGAGLVAPIAATIATGNPAAIASSLGTGFKAAETASKLLRVASMPGVSVFTGLEKVSIGTVRAVTDFLSANANVNLVKSLASRYELFRGAKIGDAALTASTKLAKAKSKGMFGKDTADLVASSIQALHPKMNSGVARVLSNVAGNVVQGAEWTFLINGLTNHESTPEELAIDVMLDVAFSAIGGAQAQRAGRLTTVRQAQEMLHRENESLPVADRLNMSVVDKYVEKIAKSGYDFTTQEGVNKYFEDIKYAKERTVPNSTKAELIDSAVDVLDQLNDARKKASEKINGDAGDVGDTSNVNAVKAVEAVEDIEGIESVEGAGTAPEIKALNNTATTATTRATNSLRQLNPDEINVVGAKVRQAEKVSEGNVFEFPVKSKSDVAKTAIQQVKQSRKSNTGKRNTTKHLVLESAGEIKTTAIEVPAVNSAVNSTINADNVDGNGIVYRMASIPTTSLKREKEFQPRVSQSGKATENSVYERGYIEGMADQPLIVWARSGENGTEYVVLGGHSRTLGLERRTAEGLSNPATVNARVYDNLTVQEARQISRKANQTAQYESTLDMAKSIYESNLDEVAPAVNKANLIGTKQYNDYDYMWRVVKDNPKLQDYINYGAVSPDDMTYIAHEARLGKLEPDHTAKIINQLVKADRMTKQNAINVVKLAGGRIKNKAIQEAQSSLFDMGIDAGASSVNAVDALADYTKTERKLKSMRSAYKKVLSSTGGGQEIKATLEKEMQTIEDTLAKAADEVARIINPNKEIKFGTNYQYDDSLTPEENVVEEARQVVRENQVAPPTLLQNTSPVEGTSQVGLGSNNTSNTALVGDDTGDSVGDSTGDSVENNTTTGDKVAKVSKVSKVSEVSKVNALDNLK